MAMRLTMAIFSPTPDHRGVDDGVNPCLLLDLDLGNPLVMMKRMVKRMERVKRREREKPQVESSQGPDSTLSSSSSPPPPLYLPHLHPSPLQVLEFSRPTQQKAREHTEAESSVY